MTPSTTSRMSDARWARVGDLAPDALTDARLQLHHAAQIAVSAGISYLAARPDDSHTALAWSPTQRALLSEKITAVRPFRIGLRVFVVSLSVMLSPMLINLGRGGKYVVAPAFIGTCLALCILLNATIDWVRGK